MRGAQRAGVLLACLGGAAVALVQDGDRPEFSLDYVPPPASLSLEDRAPSIIRREAAEAPRSGGDAGGQFEDIAEDGSLVAVDVGELEQNGQAPNFPPPKAKPDNPMGEIDLSTGPVSLKNGWKPVGEDYGEPTFILRNGFCFVSGLLQGGDWRQPLAQLPGDCRPSRRLIFNLNNHEFSSRIDVQPSGMVVWMAGGQAHGWVSLSGIRFPTAAGSLAENDLALGWGWEPFGEEYGGATYTLNKGLCIVQGTIKGSHWAGIATLPEDCRPKKRLVFSLNNNQFTARVDVLNNGEIHWIAGGKDHSWLSLTGIMFSTTGDENIMVSLLQDWSAYKESYGAPTVYQKAGICEVEGLMRGGKFGHLARLPEPCRPHQRLVFSVDNHQFPARVDVMPDGGMNWIAGGQSHGWISLSGIAFGIKIPNLVGFTGEKGRTGPPGPEGDGGYHGLAGYQGQKGDRGIMGPPGPPGVNGDPGALGEVGLQGPPGQAGAAPSTLSAKSGSVSSRGGAGSRLLAAGLAALAGLAGVVAASG